MQQLKILNNKEIKDIYKIIEKQWEAKIKLDCGFLSNNKNRIFIISKELSRIEISRLKLNSIGMYLCETDRQGMRLSIEGSQIVGPAAKRNTIELSDEEARKWLKGEDFEKECKGCNGFIIIKHGKDFMGTGKYSNGKILNYVGKSRRISSQS